VGAIVIVASASAALIATFILNSPLFVMLEIGLAGTAQQMIGDTPSNSPADAGAVHAPSPMNRICTKHGNNTYFVWI
jgi:hypothetical protein